jgi:hypothetical protein
VPIIPMSGIVNQLRDEQKNTNVKTQNLK